MSVPVSVSVSHLVRLGIDDELHERLLVAPADGVLHRLEGGLVDVHVACPEEEGSDQSYQLQRQMHGVACSQKW